MFEGDTLTFLVVGDVSTVFDGPDPFASKTTKQYIKNRTDYAVEQGWDEIDPTNFYVSQKGEIVEAAGWDKKARWNKDQRINVTTGVTLRNSVHIQFLGFGHSDFTVEAAKSIRKLVDEAMERNSIVRVVFEKDVIPNSRSGGEVSYQRDGLPSLYHWGTNGFLPWWDVDESDDPHNTMQLLLHPDWQLEVLKEMKTVKLGDVGNSVEVLQVLLKEYGGQEVAVDGSFGEETEAAVERVQAEYKLEGDRGVADETVWRHLLGVEKGE